MKRTWLIIAAVVLIGILVGVVVKMKFFSKPGTGGLRVGTTPKATVFLNGTQVGITPFQDENIEIGQYTVKLVPEVGEEDLVTWEGKVEVSPNILTVINREFAVDESGASGEILTLEKIGKKNTSSLAVVSVPDQAVVRIDNKPEGFAPVQVDDLEPGNYQVTVSSTGYKEKNIDANTVSGYKLTINVKLAQEVEGIEEEESEEGEVEGEEDEAEDEDADEKDEEETEATPTPKATPDPEITPPDKPYIKVKDTPTGWLRVRDKPNTTSSEELAKIEPDETYPYLEEEENGWYLIEYEDGEEGWVSGTYVELVE
jgi:hypothetical protein